MAHPSARRRHANAPALRGPPRRRCCNGTPRTAQVTEGAAQDAATRTPPPARHPRRGGARTYAAALRRRNRLAVAEQQICAWRRRWQRVAPSDEGVTFPGRRGAGPRAARNMEGSGPRISPPHVSKLLRRIVLGRCNARHSGGSARQLGAPHWERRRPRRPVPTIAFAIRVRADQARSRAGRSCTTDIWQENELGLVIPPRLGAVVSRGRARHSC